MDNNKKRGLPIPGCPRLSLGRPWPRRMTRRSDLDPVRDPLAEAAPVAADEAYPHPAADIHEIKRILVQNLPDSSRRLASVAVLCVCPDCSAATWQSGWRGPSYCGPNPVYECGCCGVRYHVDVFSELQLSPADIEALCEGWGSLKAE